MTYYTHQYTTRVHATGFLSLSSVATPAHLEKVPPIRDSSPIRDLSLKHLFIQLLVEMQPLENELDGRRQQRRTFDTFEPLHSLLQPPHATGFLAVDGRWHSIRDLKTAARGKILQE